MTAGQSHLEVSAFRRLSGFDLRVEFTSEPDRTVIFGPSGGGKSMTLRAIAGAVSLQTGRIAVGGRVLYDSARGVNLPSHARKVGYVPQGYGLFPHLSVEQNILYGVRGNVESKPSLLGRMLELTDLVGLERRRPGALSGGQQQRVALARALASEPDLLLLDEPFSALDASRRRALRDEVIGIQRRTGVPLVTVTHDLQDAFELGDKIVIIDGGRVLQQGTRDETFYRPATRRVAELVGMRNLISAEVISLGEGSVICDWQGRRLFANTPLPLQAGQNVTLGVRPAHLTIRRTGDSYEGRTNVISGRIVEEVVTPEGYRLLMAADGPAGTAFEIELSGYTYFRLGLDSKKDIDVSIRQDALHVIAC
jgi:molybdate transport system ATP-binding protein